MFFSEKVRVPTAAGAAFVDPDQVVAVMMAGDAAQIVLTSQERIPVAASAEAVASNLWRFTNKADNAFFNERHVNAIVSKEGGGCTVMLTGGTTIDQTIGADELITLHRSANEMRRSMTASQ